MQTTRDSPSISFRFISSRTAATELAPVGSARMPSHRASWVIAARIAASLTAIARPFVSRTRRSV